MRTRADFLGAVPFRSAQRVLGPGTGATSSLLQRNQVRRGDRWPSSQLKVRSWWTGRICVTAQTRWYIFFFGKRFIYGR